MTPERFLEIATNYSSLRIAVVGDFCLDRYLEIDPSLSEDSLETELPVYNVTRVRSQPGGAGNVLNSIAALGVAAIYPIGFCGEEGEGFELQNVLSRIPQVNMKYFYATPLRRTFTYCKPLVIEEGKTPRELNRLDSKNWTPTPKELQERLASAITELSNQVDAIAVQDQVDIADTGVVNNLVLGALHSAQKSRPELVILADSRQSLRRFPPFSFKMNRSELAALCCGDNHAGLGAVKQMAVTIARQNGRSVFITLSEKGILGASADGEVRHVKCLPLRGEIDIVGAGDTVSANLCAALAAKASMEECLEISNAAASIVIHKLGTTGTATTQEIGGLLS